MPALLAVLGAAVLAACTMESTTGVPLPTKADVLARGAYLVERVGLCADCHTQHDEKGAFVAGTWLRGAAIPFSPTVPMPWATAAPMIAGLPTLTDAQAEHFLQTGELPEGRRPRPPMPPYRFSAEDARAVVAYLRQADKPVTLDVAAH